MRGKLPPRHRQRPLIDRVPLGVREQPAWIFIGVMFVLVGLGYVTGTAQSMLSEAIGETGLKVWGSSLMLSGLLLIVATARARPSMEKLALRIMSSNIFAYAGWLLAVIPWNRAATTVVLSGSLIVLAEFRVMHIRALMKRTTIIRYELNERDR